MKRRQRIDYSGQYPHERELGFRWGPPYHLDGKRFRRLERWLTCAACGEWYRSPTPTLACSPQCKAVAVAYKRRKRVVLPEARVAQG